MSSLIHEMTVVLAISFAVTTFFFLLYREERSRFLLAWALAWLASCLRYSFELWHYIDPADTSLLRYFSLVAALANGVLLLYGTLHFLYRPLKKRWLYLFALLLIYLTFGLLFDLPFAALALPPFLFTAYVFIYSGYVFLRSSRVQGSGRLIAGIALIVWGLHKADYPFLRMNETFAHWGFLFSAFLEVIVALGIFLAFLKKGITEIQEKEQVFRFIMSNARDIIFRTRLTPDFTYEYISPACFSILGYKPEEFYETPELGLQVVHPDDRSMIERSLMQRTEPVEMRVFRVLHKDGQTIWMELNLKHIIGEEGLLEGHEGIVRDITARRQIEEQLRHSQKMEAIGLLAGGIAHDFNNLLTAISGHADLAKMRLSDPTGLLSDLDEITRSAERAAELTRQLLAYSRKQAMRLSVFNINDSLLNLESLLHRLIGENIVLETQYADKLWTIRADPTQIEQVLINLSVNARDAMPNGGKLTIRTANTTLSPEKDRPDSPAQTGDYAMISVSDTGVGIPAANLQKIFDPFFTTKEIGKGTGLGLSTVYGIIKQSQGYVRVASKSGEGSEFRVYFPRFDADSEPAEPQVKPAPADTSGKESILLVEDNESVRTLAIRLLEERGYTVHPASDGAEAIRRIEEEGLSFDLVIADVVMPEMGGVELATRLLAIAPETRLLFISGYAAGPIQNPKVSSIPLLTKPFRADELARAVRQALG